MRSLAGWRGSLIYAIGSRLAAPPAPGTELEDPSLMRFNNALAAIMLGVAQIAFAAHATIVGWALALLTALAAGVALAGYCIGCTLFFQLKQLRARALGR